MNKELKSVKKWLDVNRLSLNISKTNYIIFHSTKMKISEDISIKIGRKHLTKAKYVKFLGLLLDESLSWKFHLSELSKKLARTCGIFFKIRSLLPINTLILVYNALFLPFLQYGIIVWGQTFTSHLEPLVLIQKKIARAIAHQHPLSHTLPIFKSLKLLQLVNLSLLFTAGSAEIHRTVISNQCSYSNHSLITTGLLRTSRIGLPSVELLSKFFLVDLLVDSMTD